MYIYDICLLVHSSRFATVKIAPIYKIAEQYIPLETQVVRLLDSELLTRNREPLFRPSDPSPFRERITEPLEEHQYYDMLWKQRYLWQALFDAIWLIRNVRLLSTTRDRSESQV